MKTQNIRKVGRMVSYGLKHGLIFSLVFLSSAIHGQQSDKWQIAQIDSIKLDSKKVFIDQPSIAAELLVSTDNYELNPSIHDRILFIVQGEASVEYNSRKMRLKSGEVMFLKAQRKVRISGQTKIMLWTSKSTETEHLLATKRFTRKQIEKDRDESENVWSTFVESSTMVIGLYMLPRIIGGDNTLTHVMDEINYVVNGTAKFKMDDTVIEVQPGSVMWVKRGVGHYFYDLSEDFDVYILFETINMNH